MKMIYLKIIIGALLWSCGQQANTKRTEANSQTMEQQQKELAAGDRIELFGGYDDEPRYLQNPKVNAIQGTVLKFIDSERGDKSAVIELDNEIVGDSLTTNIVVIFARYENQNWSTSGPVHIELHTKAPEHHVNMHEPKGEWIEAAASYKIL